MPRCIPTTSSPSPSRTNELIDSFVQAIAQVDDPWDDSGRVLDIIRPIPSESFDMSRYQGVPIPCFQLAYKKSANWSG